MRKSEINELYDEVVEQLQDHLHRGGSADEAQAMHESYCSRIIEIVPQIDDIGSFIKDVAIAFAGKLEFRDAGPLKRLALGTSAEQLEEIRSAKAVSVASSAVAAWKHVATANPEAAVTVIAVSYRLYAEKKLEKLVRKERELEREQRKLQIQGEPV